MFNAKSIKKLTNISRIRLIKGYIKRAASRGETFVNIESILPAETTAYFVKKGFSVDTKNKIYYQTTIHWED